MLDLQFENVNIWAMEFMSLVKMDINFYMKYDEK